MAKLFVANATRQKIEFHYRVPEVINSLMVSIGIGQQVRVYRDDLSGPELEAIIRQLHNSMGAVAVSEIDRVDDFVGVCYSIDKPVQAAKIEAAVEHNLDVLTKQGAELRKQTAVAVNEILEQAMPASQLLESDMTIKEEVRATETPNVNEVIQVRKEGREKNPAPRRRKRA